MQLKDAIKKRQSVRKYSHKKPDWRKILRALDFASYIPAAGNLYAHKFILVRDSEKINALTECCQQEFVKTAHYVVVMVSNDAQLTKTYADKAADYAKYQAGASIQNFLLALVEQGLCTTWIGYFDDNAARRVLRIPDDMRIEAIFPIGIETAHKTKQQPKAKLENIIFFDHWGEKSMGDKKRLSI